VKFPAFALFERSLRLESRSGLMCWSRLGLLVVILLFLIGVQQMANVGYYGAPGLEFLDGMSWVNLIFISLAGISYFASAITEEKEEMMLGLLRMTDLNPVAILLGKSTSRLVGALLLLAVQVPFVLLAVTLGGVGLPQVLAAYSTLLAYLFLLCNVALLFSVICQNTGKAAAITLFLVLVFLLGHYLAAGIVADMERYYGYSVPPSRGIWLYAADGINVWRDATPSERLMEIFRTGFSGPIVGFQVVSNLTVGVVFFLGSWLVFDWCTRAEKETAGTRRWFWSRKTRRSRVPRTLVGFRAITWKDFTFITGGWPGLMIKFGVIALVVGICNAVALWGGDNLSRELEGVSLIWASIFATMLWLAIEASRVFKDEIRWKTLSSLATLPISMRELAYRKAAGALAGTLPLLAGLVLGTVIVPDKVAGFLRDIFSEGPAFWGCLAFIFQFVLFLHLTAFLSLIVKRGALALAFAIQYIGGYFVLMFSSFIFAMSGGAEAIPFLICFACFVLSLVLHFAIVVRLERVAAEE
jgi:hypothetical protein